MIPDEAVEAAAADLADINGYAWCKTTPEIYKLQARRILEAAAPHLLSHERQQTADAHLDAMVNRETKRAELAEAFAYGWREGKGWPTPVDVETGELFHDQAEQPDWNPHKEEV